MTAIDLLLLQLDQAYSRKSWHGTNLRGSIRGLTAEQVVWRPQPDRHNVQEIAVHAAYWKYTVTRRLTGEKRGSFALKGSNWFERQAPDAAAWRADQQLLEASHARLRAAVAALLPRRLGEEVGHGLSAASLGSGIVAHDLSHAGQIQLLKRLMPAG
jgi:hypothetical protein